MVRAIQYAREGKVPYFGICLGMQCAVIEFARNMCGLKDANSTEFDANTPHPVIYKLRDLLGIDTIGGTMRLGAYPANLKDGSLAKRIYEAPVISERHRHRYEFNRQFEQILIDNGLIISGVSPDKNFVEIVEIADHPWFWVANSIQSSNRSRWPRIRFLHPLLALRMNIGWRGRNPAIWP